jgi:hypothetical protein
MNKNEGFIYLRPYIDFRHKDQKDPCTQPQLKLADSRKEHNVLQFERMGKLWESDGAS